MTSNTDFQPKYVMLENQGSVRPPPFQRNVPRYHSHHRSKGSRCLRCLCYCCFCLFIFLALFILSVALVYLFMSPKAPSYKVDNLNVKGFDIRHDDKLHTEFTISVKAENPNRDIGLEYGKNGAVNIIYSCSQLCSGQIPAFVQVGKNRTKINVVLKGDSNFGTKMQHDLMQNRKTGKVPLTIKVKVPLRFVLNGIRMKEFVVRVNGHLVIDNLQQGSNVKILDSTYDYEVQF